MTNIQPPNIFGESRRESVGTVIGLKVAVLLEIRCFKAVN